MTAQRWPGSALVFLSIGLCCSCGGAPQQITRFITDPPAGDFEVSRVAQTRLIASWEFTDSADLADWTASLIDVLEPSKAGLRILSSNEDPQLLRAVRLQAEQIDAIEIIAKGGKRGQPQIFWAQEGESFSGKSRFPTAALPLGNGETLYRFELGSVDGWRGVIRLLRVDPTPVADEEVRIRRIAAVAYHATPELEAALEQPWRIERDRELRSVLLAPPGRRIARRLVVPRMGRLRFGFSRWDGLRMAASRSEQGSGEDSAERQVVIDPRLRVLIDAGEDEPEVVFEAVLDRSERITQHWNDAVVDLSRFAGREVEIALEMAAMEPGETSAAMGLWAHPEVGPAERPQGLPNVVVISIDTLRADRLSLNGYERPTTPMIDAWAARSGINFRNTVVAAPYTLPSHVSIMSGMDAVSHGVHREGRELPETLAEILNRAGYFTVAVTGGGFLSPRYGLTRGFDVYRYWDSDSTTEIEEGMSTALEWAGRVEDRPFLLFFHTYEVHSPYRAREPFFSRFRSEGSNGVERIDITAEPPHPERGDWISRFYWQVERRGEARQLSATSVEDQQLASDLYDSGVAFADRQIGRLLSWLSSAGLERDTLVVLTSDHGEALGEHGLVAHGSVYDIELMVPLVIALPSRLEGGRVIAEQVRSIDIVPTVLELLRLEPTAELDGDSLLPLIAGKGGGEAERPAWSYAANSKMGLALRVGNRLKYVMLNSPWPSLRGRESVFDLSRDPAEMRNLSAEGVDTGELRRRAVAKLDGVPALRIELHNGSAQRLEGILSGPALAIHRLKSVDLGCDCVEVLPPGQRRVRFEVPPATSFTLTLESAADGQLAFGMSRPGGLDPAGPGALALTVDLAEADKPLAWFLDGDRWVAVDGGLPPGATGVRIWRQGSLPASVVHGPSDESLDEQLRALGYLQ